MANNFVHESSICKDTVFGEKSSVYKNCYINKSILSAKATVGDFSRIEQSTIGENVCIQRNNMVYSTNIGRYTYTGKNTTIWNSDIGKFCSLSWNVNIGGANHDYNRITTHSFLYSNDFGLKPEDELGYDRFARESCIIGNDVWIAAGANICRNVRIGTGAVIGAGAVVTKDVEPYSIVVGVPAKVIKKRFSDEIIESLLHANWWDLPSEVIRDNYAVFNDSPTKDNLFKLVEICKKYNTYK